MLLGGDLTLSRKNSMKSSIVYRKGRSYS